MRHDLQHPWLVAAWPGMGGVAEIAARSLVESLRARELTELSPKSACDVRSIRVRGGLIEPGTLPRNRLFGWKHPAGGPDLTILIGEEQPRGNGYGCCRELLATAADLGVSRVVTFAAMPTQIRPEAPARVFAAATQSALLDQAVEVGAEALGEAQISGLNGVFLAAAAERDIEGLCLLGEIPFFAGGVPNPKAAAAVLRALATLAGLELELGSLDAQAVEVQRHLTENLRRLERAVRLPLVISSAPGLRPNASLPAEVGLDAEVEARIEKLFAEARNDRSKALELKTELDRHGLFLVYEDRFLDLFKQAE